MRIKGLLLLLCMVLGFTACANNDGLISEEASQNTSISEAHNGEETTPESEPESDNPNEAIIEELRQKGLLDWQIKSLAQRGFGFEEQLELSLEEIAAMFAPGSSPSYGREFSEEEMNNLEERNIDGSQIMILRSLGYEYDDMMQLTEEQLNFIFPNTELVDKLVEIGYDRESVEYIDAVNESGYGSYKELLDEVFQRNQ